MQHVLVASPNEEASSHSILAKCNLCFNSLNARDCCLVCRRPCTNPWLEASCAGLRDRMHYRTNSLVSREGSELRKGTGAQQQDYYVVCGSW